MLWISLLVGWLSASPSAPACSVRIEGMPVPQMRHHALRVGGRRYQAGPTVEVQPLANTVELDGPRYSGTAVLPERCRSVVLHAKPRPIAVAFEGAPPQAVVSCRGCPGLAPTQNVLPASMPPMQTTQWELVVTLWVRAPGFQAEELSVILHPGKNTVRLQMKRRETRSSKKLRPI